MAEYIERESVLSEIRSCLIDLDNFHDDSYYGEGINKGLREAIIAIKSAPAADVRPERHGKWIEDYMDSVGKGFSCTSCGCFFKMDKENIDEFDYCPHCSAKMDDNDAYSSLS